MIKPDYDLYHKKYLDTCSIHEAEQMIDDDRLAYRRALEKWWDSLDSKQKKQEWKKDKNHLSFYFQSPFKRK